MTPERRKGLVRPPARSETRPRKGLVVPADYPPPFTPADAIAPPTDPEEERIEVGVAIVGAGPAGLACAIRLGQLLADAPEVAERLGEVPVAVLEKGKQPGSHLLSGAVVNPRALRRLFRDRMAIEDMPFYGPVHEESVLFLTRRQALRIPTPPTMMNHGNYIASLSQFGRWLAEQAEELGATILPETAAEKLLVTDGRVRGVRTGDKGRGRAGEELANFEPGSDVVARITVLAEGTQGHLTGAALQHFALAGEQPQVWALGVKEVWKVPRPLGRVIHTMGWPLRSAAKYREFGGSFIYPMGEELVTIGMVVGLDYRDAALSVHDLLQELKTHPRIRKILDGGERVAWGAKTIPEGGFVALPKRLHAPGLLICGDGAGMVNVPALKGIHYAMESGRLAAEAAFAALGRGQTPWTPGALASYDESVRESFIWRDLREVRNMRQAFGRGFWLGGALAGMMTATKGRLPPGDARTERDAEQPLVRTDRAKRYPGPDGRLTFDKLSSVFASGNRARDDQPNHIRLQRRVPLQLAEAWIRMCPAHVYELGEGHGDGTVTVEVTPSNCVQCGAITAKGGRLTPPEGGSGPEYTLT
jgi:electron-transferring-flavoprotein dehydrogenase